MEDSIPPDNLARGGEGVIKGKGQDVRQPDDITPI